MRRTSTATSRHSVFNKIILRDFRAAEIFSSILMSLAFSVSFGFFETNSTSNATVSNLIIFNHFAIWHLGMAITVFTLGLIVMSFSIHKGNFDAAFLAAVADVLLFAVAEDIAWYAFRDQWVSYGAWSTWYLGGVNVWNTFIPWTYIILLVGAALMYAAAYEVLVTRQNY